MFFYSFLACVFGRFLCSFLQILATFCATSLWLFLVFFWCFFTFFWLFLWCFFVAFWLHFWRFLRAFLTSFGGSVSRPAIGEESAHAFLGSRQSFHTKNVLFFFPSVIRAFILFLLFLEKKEKCNAIKKNEKKRNKKNNKNLKKQRKNSGRNTKINFIFKSIACSQTRGYLRPCYRGGERALEGTCQNGTSKIRETLREKGSKQHAQKELKRAKKTPNQGKNKS